MGKVTLSQAVFENLVQHLAEAEEGKNKIFDQYFPEPSKDRNDFADLYETYIRQIDHLVKNAEKSNGFGYEVPFIVIGSKVELEDLSNNEVVSYNIVSPFQVKIDRGDVSCLSPMGRSLLLKKPGDEVEVKAPGGLFRYKVLSIQLSDSTQ
ncbi:MAG: GreA/GreB family elongation factor [Clostridiales bacterium]|nr:GreA/GreB family elongation factor [Clostridiales bacterium]